MHSYKLLTPGPLTTTETVKREMQLDRCTWDQEYKGMTQAIRSQLLQLAHVTPQTHTAVLMQGSGTFGVESVLSSAIGARDKCLFLVNGAYGERMVTIAKRHKLRYTVLRGSCREDISLPAVRALLEEDGEITHVVMVHCETTTGILNDLDKIAALCQTHGKALIVDAMSSFGAVDIDVKALGIAFLISSANKCIQGVPGFSFVIAALDALRAAQGRARTLSLDLYDQWREMDRDGKWRFTSPTHVVAAFSQALRELAAEGGVKARGRRYAESNRLLRERMAALGFQAYVDEALQSPVITTFLLPAGAFDFQEMYQYIKARGYVIYPGKLTDADTFRIGNIGEIYRDDIEKLSAIFASYIEERNHA